MNSSTNSLFIMNLFDLVVGFGVKHNNDIIDTVHEEEVKDIKSVLRFYWKLTRFKNLIKTFNNTSGKEH